MPDLSPPPRKVLARPARRSRSENLSEGSDIDLGAQRKKRGRPPKEIKRIMLGVRVQARFKDLIDQVWLARLPQNMRLQKGEVVEEALEFYRQHLVRTGERDE